MPIDRVEAMVRATQYFVDKPYVGTHSIARLAYLIQAAVKETALECSEICRRHANRGPGGLVPVGAGARASDEIRSRYGLKHIPLADLKCRHSKCPLCGGTGVVTTVLGAYRCPCIGFRGEDFPGSTPGIEGGQ